MLVEVIYKAKSHGPMSMEDAAKFVHASCIPETAAVRRIGQKPLLPLRQFPELVRAARAAAEGRALDVVSDSPTPAEADPMNTPGRSFAESMLALLWGGAIFVFSIWGLFEGQIPLVGGSRSSAVTIGGGGFWIMLCANAFLVLANLAIVASNVFAQRRTAFRLAASWLGGLGVGLLVTAIVVGIDHSQVL